MKFKAEISMLLLAIALYIASAFCYSYESPWESMLPKTGSHPYEGYAIPLAGVASALLVIAAILYSRRK